MFRQGCGPGGGCLRVDARWSCLLVQNELSNFRHGLLGGFPQQDMGALVGQRPEFRGAEQTIDGRYPAEQRLMLRHGQKSPKKGRRQEGRCGSVAGGGCKVAHQGIDLAGGHGHDQALDGADFLFVDALFPGDAKVVRDSWLALPGHGGGEADDGHGALIQKLLIAHGIVEGAIGFMLSGRQHGSTFILIGHKGLADFHPICKILMGRS